MKMYPFSYPSPNWEMHTAGKVNVVKLSYVFPKKVLEDLSMFKELFNCQKIFNDPKTAAQEQPWYSGSPTVKQKENGG